MKLQFFWHTWLHIDIKSTTKLSWNYCEKSFQMTSWNSSKSNLKYFQIYFFKNGSNWKNGFAPCTLNPGFPQPPENASCTTTPGKKNAPCHLNLARGWGLRWQGAKKNFFCQGAGVIQGWGGRVRNRFSNLKHLKEIKFENTSNWIFLSFKMSSESFFHKFFEAGLTFWNMWF